MINKKKKIKSILQGILCLGGAALTVMTTCNKINGDERGFLSVTRYNSESYLYFNNIDFSDEDYTPTDYFAYICSNAVPLYNESDDESSIMYIADYADKVKVVGEDSGKSYGWTQISINNHIGYVKSKYISTEELSYEFDYGLEETELYCGSNQESSPVMGEDAYNASLADIVVQKAYELIGVPYGHGYTSKLTDCVGLTQMCYGAAGIVLPWSLEQKNYGTSVPYNDIRMGDLLVWSPLDEERVSHVGVYVGNGNMIHASCSKGVTETSVSHYIKYGGNLVDIRRLL